MPSTLQAINPAADLATDAREVVQRPRQRANRLTIHDDIPAVCTVADVAALLGVSESRVHQMRAAGQLSRFLLDDIGTGFRFCGKKLDAWRNGESVSVAANHRRLFGHKAAAARK